MPELDYTQDSGPITRNGRWPPAGGSVRVILTRTENEVPLNWPAGAETWTWELLISRNQYGQIPDLVLPECGIHLVGHIMSLRFAATAAQTNTLPGMDRERFFVHVRSTHAGAYSFYAYGRAEVESATGEA